jgi:predicted DNA-binding transcriptional regulator YafY
LVAVVAANPGEAALQVAAVEKFVDHFGDDRAQDAVARLVSLRVHLLELLVVAVDALPERRLFRISGAINSLDVESLTDRFSVLSEDHARVNPEVWQAAGRAIKQQEGLRLEYQRFDGVTGRYVVEPYHLAAYHGNWYLLALNTAAGRTETFALSRCRSIEGTWQHFARPADFDARSFFKDAFGISQAQKPWKVRLLFAKEVAAYIRERVWHSSQQLRERRDGRLEIRLETSGRKELTRWILSWMPNVKLLAPRQLKERVKQRLRQGLAITG